MEMLLKEANKWIYLNTRMIILGFIIINIIDMTQTYYYLNKYGFEWEENPLVTNNFWIVGVKFIYGLPMVLLMFLTTKIPSFFNRFKKKNPNYSNIIELSKTPFYVWSLLVCAYIFINLYQVVLSNQYYITYAITQAI